MDGSLSKNQRQAADNIRRWRERPPAFVREVFGVEPDAWQDEALTAFPASPRMAMKAAAGPGKSALLAWLGWNFLLTRPHPVVGATSISGDNLKANLWTELARWRAMSPLLTAAFEMTKSEIFARENPQTWKLEARTWPKDANTEQLGQALAGLHAKYVMWLVDESGGMPDAILPILEGIFAGEPVEAHIVQAGNPIQRGGPLYHACHRARPLWKIIEITGDPDDPKRSSRISIEHAREQIKQYGRDNPWVQARILGQFPAASITSLISEDELVEATGRVYQPSDIAEAARVLGVDVARFGDDASVCFPRQGLVLFDAMVWRNVDGNTGSGAIARKWQDWDADACFVDDTGGFGSSWIDGLRRLGRSPIGIPFSGEPHDRRYYNKRTEMAFDFVKWVKEGGQIPNCPELIAAAATTTYGFRGDRLLLQPKDQVKEALGFSPDYFDAAMLTMAEPVVRSARHSPASTMPRNHQTEYDPWHDILGKRKGGPTRGSWMPGKGYG